MVPERLRVAWLASRTNREPEVIDRVISLGKNRETVKDKRNYYCQTVAF